MKNSMFRSLKKNSNKIAASSLAGIFSLRTFLLLTAFILAIPATRGQVKSEEFKRAFSNINQSVLKAQLGFLASDWMEGRMAGEKGEYIASDYIASLLQLYGVRPGGDKITSRSSGGLIPAGENSYFQNFVLIKTNGSNEHIMKIGQVSGNTSWSAGLDYNIDFYLGFQNQSKEIEAPVVFAGYGFKSEKLKHDDLSKLDLKGKFVLRIAGLPPHARKTLSVTELAECSRESERIIRSLGAAGIIEFSPGRLVAGNPAPQKFLDMSPAERRPVPDAMYSEYQLPAGNAEEQLLRITVSEGTAAMILKGSGIDPEDYVRRSESEPYRLSADIKDIRVYIKTTVKKEAVRVRNIIGIIEGRDPDQYIVLGAHYDHMGSKGGYIWNGADDNGSGTVGILTLAKAIMETGIKPEKNIIIALWTAEETGLLGSRYFVDNLPFPRERIKLNLNFDMISRYVSDDSPKKVTMTYTDSHPGFRTITEENLRIHGIDLDVDFQPSPDPPGGSDHRSFTSAGIPVMRFKPGHREEYHTPADEVSTIDWDIMERIVKISFANIWQLANSKW